MYDPNQQYDQYQEHGLGLNQGNIAIAGSNYLRGMQDNQYNDSINDENWDDTSEQSEAENYDDCEDRAEFVFENRARYKG